jgi:hypothetical protein
VRTGREHGLSGAVNVTSALSLRGNIESDVNHTRHTGWAFGNQTKTVVRDEPCVPENGVERSRSKAQGVVFRSLVLSLMQWKLARK